MALLINTLANLDMMRERLFSLNEPVHLSAEQKDAYWPYVSNIWCRKDKMITPHGALSKELWRCRRSRSSRPKTKVDGVKHRNRQAFKADCACFMVVTHWQNGFWTFQRRTKTHSHTLQEADSKKKNVALQDAALEFIRKHGDVVKIAQKKQNKLTAQNGTTDAPAAQASSALAIEGEGAALPPQDNKAVPTDPALEEQGVAPEAEMDDDDDEDSDDDEDDDDDDETGGDDT